MSLTKNHIHQSNLIEGFDDEYFDKELWNAANFILSQPSLTKASILSAQRQLTSLQPELTNSQRGHTRNFSRTEVFIGDAPAPSWWLVDPMLDNWILDMKEHWKTLDPREMHVRFEHIHPFVDGNGRTGRLLMWWHEIKLGKEPLLITFDDRWGYYEWFQR